MATFASQTKNLMFCPFFPYLLITSTNLFSKNIGNKWGKIASYFHTTYVEQEK